MNLNRTVFTRDVTVSTTDLIKNGWVSFSVEVSVRAASIEDQLKTLNIGWLSHTVKKFHRPRGVVVPETVSSLSNSYTNGSSSSDLPTGKLIELYRFLLQIRQHGNPLDVHGMEGTVPEEQEPTFRT